MTEFGLESTDTTLAVINVQRGEVSVTNPDPDAIDLPEVIEVRIDDDGAGIPPGDRERSFERFVRLDEGRSRDEGGSGLGLPIVREIVRAHGGEVVLADAPLGGLRAEVRLPSTR